MIASTFRQGHTRRMPHSHVLTSSRDTLLTLADRIDTWLPQTQCTRCGYPRCRAYAEAVAKGKADINQCTPGGEVTIQALSRLLGVAAKPLNPVYGEHKPRTKAVIEEVLCIGCRKCIDVCPVDAIIGARQLMHTVIEHECTGCELCLPPCPVDCIAMVPVAGHAREPWQEYSHAEADRWRERTLQRLARLSHRKQERLSAREKERSRQIKAEIRAAVERVKARKEHEG